MKGLRAALLAASVMVFAISPAAAQNSDTYFGTPGGGGVNGAVGMCLDASNKARPCSDPLALPSPTSGNAAASTPAGAASAVPVAVNPYPAGATAITASATGTTAATTATLAAAAGKFTYLCGFSIDATATAATTGNATVTGTITGTLNFTQGVAVSPAVGSVFRTFTPCVPSSAANTAIAINAIAAGTGGVTSVTAWGYRL